MTHGDKDKIEIFCDAVGAFLRRRKKLILSVASMLFVLWILLFANGNGLLGHGYFRFSSARIDGIVGLFSFLFPWILPCLLIAYGNAAWRVVSELYGLKLVVPTMLSRTFCVWQEDRSS
jgi:hypothetical protein